MQIAIALYDGCTALDAVGPYEVLSRLPGASVTMTGALPGPVVTDTGMMSLHVDATYAEVTAPDVVLVPGGPGQRAHRPGSELHAWLHAVDRTSTWTTSVCTGSLVLASAGLLTGRRATTHWLARDELSALGAVTTDERVVVDGKYVTAAGVSAGIDMALALAARAAGEDLAEVIQLGIEYDPHPPFDAGCPDRAPREAVELLEALRDSLV